MANPYQPDQGLALGAAIAGGAQSFMSAYQGAQQRGVENARHAEEIQMRRELYRVQMQKLQKDNEPVQVDIMKVGLASRLLEQNPNDKDYANMRSKAISNALGNLDTPAKIAYANSIINSSTGQINLNKEESAMVNSSMNRSSSENIRGAMLDSQQGIAKSKEAIEYEKITRETQAKQAEINRKYEEDRGQQAKWQTETTNRAEADKKDYEIKLQNLSQQADKARQDLEKFKEEMAFNEKKLSQEEKLKLAELDNKNKDSLRREGVAKTARAATSRETPESRAINTSIQAGETAIDKAIQAPAGVMEDETAKEQRINQLRQNQYRRMDAYREATGSKHPLDSRQPPSRITAPTKSGGGEKKASGPNKALPFSQKDTAPLGSLIDTPKGIVRKVGQGKYELAE